MMLLLNELEVTIEKDNDGKIPTDYFDTNFALDTNRTIEKLYGEVVVKFLNKRFLS